MEEPLVLRELNNKIAGFLSRGGVGIIPTDTIYGLVGSALNKKTVERIYKLRRRNLRKPMIVLIGSMSDLKKFGVKIGVQEKRILNRIWPNKVSVILPCPSRKFAYLHRGTKSIAFRLPKPARLHRLLQKTGPLVAPSANWEGEKPARTVSEARKYFGEKVDPVVEFPMAAKPRKSTLRRKFHYGVDFYVDGGRRVSRPSTLLTIKDGRLKVLREGAVIVEYH
jgi:L-threonylcarbamoyladenylate synthase